MNGRQEGILMPLDQPAADQQPESIGISPWTIALAIVLAIILGCSLAVLLGNLCSLS